MIVNRSNTLDLADARQHVSQGPVSHVQNVCTHEILTFAKASANVRLEDGVTGAQETLSGGCQGGGAAVNVHDHR